MEGPFSCAVPLKEYDFDECYYHFEGRRIIMSFAEGSNRKRSRGPTKEEVRSIRGDTGETALIVMKNISKRFPGVVANNRIDFRVEENEIHALLGENGAGKTSLMNILNGTWHPDEGEIFISGKKIDLHHYSTHEAIKLKIGMVHQHFALVPRLTVAENIILGSRLSRTVFLNLDLAKRQIKEISKDYGLDVDLGKLVAELTAGECQRVEIVKVLFRGIDILILDEPTSLLTPQESKQLFKTLKAMKQKGHTIIFITHKMKEVMEISDHITVLRDGSVISTVKKEEVDPDKLAKMMVGRGEAFLKLEKKKRRLNEPIMSIKNLVVKSDAGISALKGISFDLFKGSVLGVAGVSGSGQQELCEAIMGLRKIKSGEIVIGGENTTNYNTASLLSSGLGYVPEDRINDGTISELSVAKNFLLGWQYTKPFKKGWFLDQTAIQKNAITLIKEYNIKVSNYNVAVKTLSGGNIQKLILAREISRKPRVLIVNNPTYGLDIGATDYVRKSLITQRELGAGILLISNDLEEIKILSDQIIVIFSGEIIGSASPDDSSEEIGLMMTGMKSHFCHMDSEG
jgi:ABC-type uncharacterized transport system ATPase subunit